MTTTFKPRTYDVTIYQGDDLAKIAEARAALDEAVAAEQSAGPRLMSEVPESDGLREKHNALVAAAKKRAPVVTLTALGRTPWRTLVAAHPPREGHKGDEAVGVNEETFKDALVPVSVTGVKPTQGDLAAFLEVLSDAQFDELYAVAFYLNRAVGETPKALSLPSPSSPEIGK